MKADKPDKGGNGSQQLRSTVNHLGNAGRSGDAVEDVDTQNENYGNELDDDTVPGLATDSEDDDVPFNL